MRRGRWAAILEGLCDEEGQSLVTVALMMPVIAIVLGLVFDIGYAYIQRRVLQNAADAASLAGVRALIVGADAEWAAEDYGARNGADGVTVVVDEGQCIVRVTAQETLTTFMSGVLDANELVISASAGAMCGAVSEVDVNDGLYPIAVPDKDENGDPYVMGGEYEIFGGDGPGNFGWLGWDGCVSAQCICGNLTPPGYGSGMDIGILDTVPGAPGVNNSACIRSTLNHLIDTKREITLVVWDYSEGSGSNLEYHVTGFATFVLLDYRLPGQDSITARFVESTFPTTKIQPGQGFGTIGTRLVD